MPKEAISLEDGVKINKLIHIISEIINTGKRKEKLNEILMYNTNISSLLLSFMDHYDYLSKKLVDAVEETMNKVDFENKGENDAFQYIYKILKDFCNRGKEVENCFFHIVYFYDYRKKKLVKMVI